MPIYKTVVSYSAKEREAALKAVVHLSGMSQCNVRDYILYVLKSIGCSRNLVLVDKGFINHPRTLEAVTYLLDSIGRRIPWVYFIFRTY